MWSPGQGHFGPGGGGGGIIYKQMLHTKYHGSMPYGFRQEDFIMFLPI